MTCRNGRCCRQKTPTTAPTVSHDRYEAEPIPCPSEFCRMNGYSERMRVNGDTRTCPVCEFQQRVTRTGWVFAECEPLADDERAMLDAAFAPDWPPQKIVHVGMLVAIVIAGMVVPVAAVLLGN